MFETQIVAAPVNVGVLERWASLLGGSALAFYGLRHFTPGGTILTLVGGSLVYRGLTGHCSLYELLDINTAEHGQRQGGRPLTSVPANQGIKVEESILVNRPPEEIYPLWRDLTNLPRYMSHLKSVRLLGNGRSRWEAHAPLGRTVAWEAELIQVQPNHLIAWRSLEGSDVDSAGSVHFSVAPDFRGTIVRVALKYEPPAGKLGEAFAKLFGEAPGKQIQEDLRHFKQLMEVASLSPLF